MQRILSGADGCSRLSWQAGAVQVQGSETGEILPIVVSYEGKSVLGVGSGHQMMFVWVATDRSIE